MQENIITNLNVRYLNEVPKDLLVKLREIDFSLIEARMTYKYKWTSERIKIAIEEYLQYLYFTQLFDFQISPTADIDELWHQHILHTLKYTQDCMKVFGFYLHHLPVPSISPINANTYSGEMCSDSQDCCNDAPDRVISKNELISAGTGIINPSLANDQSKVVRFEVARLYYLSLGSE